MRYQFIADHEPEHRITAMCRALQVSKSGFYGWQRRPESGRAQANRHLLGCIRTIHVHAREAYGVLKTWRVLQEAGLRCGRNRVAGLAASGGVDRSVLTPGRGLVHERETEPPARH